MDKVEIPAGALDYTSYRKVVEGLIAAGTTTGINITPDRIAFTKLNDYRMNRLEKSAELNEELVKIIGELKEKETWLVITEAWCGDSAQTIPVMELVARASNGNIRLLLTGRDDHPELISHFTTDGNLAIPKLIRLREGGHVLGVWGPRPAPAQEMRDRWKQSEGAISKEDFHKELHLWYARDRGATLQTELLQMMRV